MKIIISPAKNLNSKLIKFTNTSEINFLNETKYLIDRLKQYNINEISTLMGVSLELAELNYNRFQNWDLNSNEAEPAISLFDGDVYKGLSVSKLSVDDLNFMQNNLRIISGLYGLLRPMDIIFPYRLEMGTKMKTKHGKNLYLFWGDKLFKFLKSEMNNDEVLVNLASEEYSRSINLNSLSNDVVAPVFKDYKNGKFKVISFFAKKARGKMLNFIIKNRITDYSDLKLFNQDGYKFSIEQDGKMLFQR